jgi:hypothetical protein
LPTWSLSALGLLGALLWIAAQLSLPAPPRLWADEEAARAAALAELSTSGVAVDDWSVHVTAVAASAAGRDYVFEEAGPGAYAELSGTYFDAPRWLVRLVDWDADPEARVEEYRVWVGEGGRVTRVLHVLPEATPNGRALRLGRFVRADLDRAPSWRPGPEQSNAESSGFDIAAQPGGALLVYDGWSAAANHGRILAAAFGAELADTARIGEH